MKLIDIEMTIGELQEFCDYHARPLPQVAKQDENYVQVHASPSFTRLLQADNIAYWAAGELL